ncbi:MAG: histidine phosphotransferase family protein [Roseovarius sp.]
MPHPSDKIASLIGSRICHDLISPVGAVANGLELLELSGLPKSPEFSLVAESAGHASARIQYFRLAFGDAEPEQAISGQAVADILAAVYEAGRIEIDWQASGDFSRPGVKAALLALMCVEQALVAGGRIVVSREGARWHLRAEAERLAPDPALWDLLNGAPGPEAVPPAAVQFLLLPHVLGENSANINFQATDKVVEISF